ncbi:hypothetical protein A2966_00050 [Candidatus Roizmanbacteria bacterium RIFCSPLOWO2_01_FULL_41_22]|uniref:Uncharacterized protein n=1 Tax=Candidatus Roizmanbacteria bacterium RIFCSPLOWO2_01_FULL_41_22 TaxID=1802067 RepID=A0A1F7J707_9BACT|nr:MAG: hypothetical protein A2966_00050 [Candidatus Roizmanbacteria bacterium RIFCSPLOWO2_01_FULL_41_22]
MRYSNLIAVGAVVLILGVYGLISYQQTTKNAAVDSCIRAATSQTTEASEGRNRITSEPNTQWYEQCMRDKGYK